MAWNDDPSNGKNQNPNEGPPDLDALFKKLQAQIGQWFGAKKNNTASGFKPKGLQTSMVPGIGFIAAIVFIIYILSGIYIVDPAQEAVIQRFGQYVRTEGEGPHWLPRFIETADIVNVMRVESTTHGGEMLTRDENIIDAKIAVQYRISNARDYLFNLTNPDESLKQVSESALRAVVGQSSLNEILTTGRAEITKKIRSQIQMVLDSYHSGLQISDLAMQQTKPPAAVQDAFDDAIKAQQDEERFVNQAQAYARKHVPIAQGYATRILEEAKAYQEQTVLLAQGEAVRFMKLLPQYQANPKVTRDRLYLETMQQVYANTNKVLMNVSGNNNIMYLPLDKIASQPKQSPIALKEEGLARASAVPALPSALSNLTNVNRPSYADIDRLKYTQNQEGDNS